MPTQTFEIGWLRMCSDGSLMQSDGSFTYQTVVFIFIFTILVISEIHLVLYNQFHMDQALLLIVNDERFTQPLLLDLLPTDEGNEPMAAAANIDPIIEEAIESVPQVEDELPPDLPEQRNYSTTASLSLGLDNQEAYTKLSTCLHQIASLDAIPVGLDGACLFSSIRRIFDVPMGYTSMHLRWQLVITLCNHKDFFYPIMVESIKGTYGFPRMLENEYEDLYNRDLLTEQQVQDHNCPGPFRFLGYLRTLLEPNFWGDELCLCLLSMAVQIGITVVNAEGFICIRFRHKQTIPNSDIILCHCKGQHYVPAPKSFSPCFAIRWLKLQLDSLQLHSDGCCCNQTVVLLN